MDDIRYPTLTPKDLANIRNNNHINALRDRFVAIENDIAEQITKANNMGLTRIYFDRKIPSTTKEKYRNMGYIIGKEFDKCNCGSTRKNFRRFIDWANLSVDIMEEVLSRV